jgi:hypothetical protein
MILPSGGCGFWGWRAGWGEVIWRERRTWSWCPGWCRWTLSLAPICQEWNTVAHLNEYEGSPEGRPFTREELQCVLDYADDQVDRAVRAKLAMPL